MSRLMFKGQQVKATKVGPASVPPQVVRQAEVQLSARTLRRRSRRVSTPCRAYHTHSVPLEDRRYRQMSPCMSLPQSACMESTTRSADELPSKLCRHFRSIVDESPEVPCAMELQIADPHRITTCLRILRPRNGAGALCASCRARLFRAKCSMACNTSSITETCSWAHA